MDGKFDRRMRSQREREIYRPGSGPLKRTEPQDSKSPGKNDSCEQLNYPKNDRNNDINRGCFENPAFHYDRRKTRKPDASIYVPKQNRGQEDDSECGTTSQMSYNDKPNKMMTRERCISRSNEAEQRHDPSSKQQYRSNRTEMPSWEPVKENVEFRKFDGKPHDSRVRERVYSHNNSDRGSGQHHAETKGGNYFNRFDHRDRSGNDKNRSGRNVVRHGNSNTITLPDTFNNLPPRLQKQHLQKEGLSPEEIEKYLNDLKIMPTMNRDTRYSQAQPLKTNRNSHFKMNKSKEPLIRNSRVFHQKPRFSESSDSGVPPANSKQMSSFSESKSLIHSTENWDPEPVHEHEDVSREDDGQQTINSAESSSDEGGALDDTDEVINWAEEVEREQQNAERNSRETNEENNDKKRDRRKRRRRELFRKKRGFSYERKEPQRTRNPSEGDYEYQRSGGGNSGSGYSKTTNESGSDNYLSWRRPKAPSPTRNRTNMMGKNYPSDKYENRNNSSVGQQHMDRMSKMSNQSKIISRINDLPMTIKDQATSSDKEHVAGIIKLPQPPSIQPLDRKCLPPVFPQPQHLSSYPNKPTKQLYNPTNPKQPIIVPNQSVRATIPPLSSTTTPHYTAQTPADQTYVPVYMDPSVSAIVTPGTYVNDQYVMSRPAWYDAYSDSFRSTHNAHLLLDISRADTELQKLLLPGAVFHHWERISELRIFLQDALKTLLTSDLTFCESENVEQHMWKILFYNIIELLRKCMYDDTTNAMKYKNLLFSVLEKGTEYFRSLLSLLEHVYKIKIDDYLLVECPSTKTFHGLALISAQKIFLFLGDLARYKENTEQSSAYTAARQWYIKANQLIPRNGRPYNQLAILAVYGRKKFDAVYYYMRSLMASNPFFTARESLLALFDENRKKYEQVENERRELKEQKKQEKAKEKESVINGSMLRKETWIRPDDGKRIQRTTSTSQEFNDSDTDELSALSVTEIHKQFLLSFLHVHGKLFSKVGMETLVEAATEMLKEFKALLAYSPLPITTTRLIQLLALNMFAIDNGQLKDPTIESGGYHSAVQESALVISLQMFSLILNRCIQLLRDQLIQMKDQESAQKDTRYPLIVSADVQLLLPSIKLWCDWLFCHSAVWNPPPSCQDYRISGCIDCWNRLAILINILEQLDYQGQLKKNGYRDPILIMSDEKTDLIKITLEEDVALRGFTPLMFNDQQLVHTHKQTDMTLAQICLRIHRILFFGTMFLCGVDPPVLKLHKTDTGKSEYISVVEEGITPKDQSDNENTEERWSDPEDENVDKIYAELSNRDNVSVTDDKALLHRKRELERIQQKREKYMRDKKETINKEMAAVSIEMEIKPHYLVPDTNCFIDHLDELEKIAKSMSATTQRPLYSLMIPVIVLSELEGIARGVHKDEDVTERARYALKFLQNPCAYHNIKCVTTRGSVLPSTRFTSEEDYSKVEKNDDKILTTCLNLCKHSTSNDSTADSLKKIYREVVLLTEDRNLRVKALSSNMPVQTVSDFIAWAELD